MFPWFGTLERASEPAAAEARAFAAAYSDRALERVMEVRLEALEVARLGERIALIDERRALLAQIVEHESSVMAQMDGSYSETLEMTLMLAMLDDQRVEFATMRDTMVQDLRASLGGGEVTSVDASAFVARWSTIEIDREALINSVSAQNPALVSMQEMVDAELARAQVERDMALPMPALEVGIGLMAGAGDVVVGSGAVDSMSMPEVMGMIGIHVPVVIGRASFEARGTAMEEQAAAIVAEIESMRRMAIGMVEEALVEVAGARERLVRLDRDLLPLAADVTEHVLAELGRGPADYVDVLRAVDRELQLLAEQVDVQYALVSSLVRADRYAAGHLSRTIDADWQIPTFDDSGAP
jgi:outer membrane protein TolC